MQKLEEAEELYRAVAGVEADPNQEQAGFTIDVEFLGGLSDAQKNAFKAAARRWSRVITGDLPAVTIDGRTIDDILISAKGEAIDGPREVLGRAGPRRLRSRSLLPATGEMTFDTADLDAMERDGSLEDVIAHEMGHCLGIGTLWGRMRLITGAGGESPLFTGAGARREYGTLIHGDPADVPVENSGGPGTRDGHWRDTTFGNEMMTGYVSSQGNPISRLTVASLGDMGYAVDLGAAEPYALPRLDSFFKASVLREHWEMERPAFEELPPDAAEG
jgi:hypothetical protein